MSNYAKFKKTVDSTPKPEKKKKQFSLFRSKENKADNGVLGERIPESSNTSEGSLILAERCIVIDSEGQETFYTKEQILNLEKKVGTKIPYDVVFCVVGEDGRIKKVANKEIFEGIFAEIPEEEPTGADPETSTSEATASAPSPAPVSTPAPAQPAQSAAPEAPEVADGPESDVVAFFSELAKIISPGKEKLSKEEKKVQRLLNKFGLNSPVKSPTPEEQAAAVLKALLDQNPSGSKDKKNGKDKLPEDPPKSKGGSSDNPSSAAPAPVPATSTVLTADEIQELIQEQIEEQVKAQMSQMPQVSQTSMPVSDDNDDQRKGPGIYTVDLNLGSVRLPDGFTPSGKLKQLARNAGTDLQKVDMKAFCEEMEPILRFIRCYAKEIEAFHRLH